MELSHAMQLVARSSLAAARPLPSRIPRPPTMTPFRCMFSTGPTRFAPPPPPPPPSAAEATAPPTDSKSPLAPWTDQSARQRLQKQFRQRQLANRGPSAPPRPEFSGPSLWDSKNRGSGGSYKSLGLGVRSGMGSGMTLEELSESQRTKSLEEARAAQGTLTHFDAEELRTPKKVDVEMRLRPSTGRTIYCRNTDAARAFLLLQRAVQRNKVAKDFHRQRFHERPGLKRKRLRSERWRQRFKKGFQATCNRVIELRNQGW